MIALDTNVLVRYFLKDDVRQYKKAAELIEKFANQNDGCFISIIVLCELVWVLKSCAKIPKVIIINLIHELLTTNGFVFEHENIVYSAVLRYKAGKGDFSDYIISETAKKSDVIITYTFDKKLKSDDYFIVI